MKLYQFDFYYIGARPGSLTIDNTIYYFGRYKKYHVVLLGDYRLNNPFYLSVNSNKKLKYIPVSGAIIAPTAILPPIDNNKFSIGYKLRKSMIIPIGKSNYQAGIYVI